ncbi:GTP-binding protein [Butyrivibrio sp. NC3005]|uniref:GTP-binding protein n=1 Tax=Butyrivibrio sp. NC3005 TaxID=1280685 RepID=UPI0003F8C6D4|nr:GTP-binding protein [Butyrivibrio sp. NC3005]
MIKVDLITGFLGSGKTTFIRKYVEYLLGKDEKICILENDYGAINVDMLLLSDLLGENLGLEMVVGGDGATAHRRRFKTKLISMAMMGYKRIIVEPSGIFDMDEFFDTFYEEPLDRWYEMGSVIAIVDSTDLNSLSKESEYIFASEIADAGSIILSKTQLSTKDNILKVKGKAMKSLLSIGCDRDISNLFIDKDWEDFSDEDFSKIASSGYKNEDFVKMKSEEFEKFNSLFYFGVNLDKETLIQNVKKVFEDKNCGKVHRIKGFARCKDSFLQINATPEKVTHSSGQTGREVIIVIGENLDKEEIGKYFPTTEFTKLID